MAVIKPVWTLAQSLRPAAVVNTGQHTSADNDHIDLATVGADAARVFIDVAMGASTEILIEAFSSVDSGTSLTDEAFFNRTVRANSSFDFLVLNMPWVRVVITNVAGGNSGLIGVTYAWRQWSSTP